MQRYFATYPGVKRYLEETKALAREQGYRRDAAGPAALLPGAARPRPPAPQAYAIRQAAERAAINHPIQGTAADIIKIAMIRLFQALNDGRLPRRASRCRCTTSWCWKCPDEELAAVARAGQETMEGAYDPEGRAEGGHGGGPNWSEMDPIEVIA